jgi:hypothetical protein
MTTYDYTKTYGDSGELQLIIDASLSGCVGVTWNQDGSPNLFIDFETELSVDDKTTLDTIVADYED